MATNNVTVIGNLVEDPELRFTPSGVALAKIRVAVNRRWRDQSNEWQEETSFFGGTLWREAAENAAESLTKGARVIITGSLEQRSWETQEGDKRSIVEVRIDDGPLPSDDATVRVYSGDPSDARSRCLGTVAVRAGEFSVDVAAEDRARTGRRGAAQGRLTFVLTAPGFDNAQESAEVDEAAIGLIEGQG